MLYDLATPHGPILCVRYGPKRVRFDPEDIRAYAESCKCMPRDLVKEAGPAKMRTVILKASSPDGESELTKLFRAHGLEPKKRPPRK
jgi:hypothetical protein